MPIDDVPDDDDSRAGCSGRLRTDRALDRRVSSSSCSAMGRRMGETGNWRYTVSVKLDYR